MPVFERHDFDSAPWKKLKAHAEERLAKLRAKNDNDLDDRKTMRLRGQIAELKHWIGMDAEKPPLPPEDVLFKD